MDLIDILLGAKLGGGSGGGGGSSTFVPSFGTVASVSLGTTWSGNDPYTSTVTVTGYTVTDKTMVSVLPSTAVLTQMLEDGTTNIYITNNNGTLTATALGAAPTQAMTLTVLCSESDQAASIGALPSIVGDGVIETLQAADLTDAVNQLGTDVSDVKNAIDELSNVLVDVISTETTLSLLAQQTQKILTPADNGNITDGNLSTQNVYAFNIQGYDGLHFNFYGRLNSEAYYAFYNAQELSGCSSETIIGAVTAYVSSGADNYVNQIPVGAKIVVIAARTDGIMRGITKTVVSKADTGLADAYSNAHIYYVGDYCAYNGNVYRRTVYTGNAEAWDETKWEQIKPTTAIQQNTDRFVERNYFDSDLFQIGSINSNGEIVTNQRYRIVNTDLIHITEVTTIDVDDLYDCTIYYYDADGTLLSHNGGIKTYQYLTILPDSYVRFRIGKTGSYDSLQEYQIKEFAHAISFASAYTKQKETIQNNNVCAMKALEAKVFQKGASPVAFDKYPCILVAGQSNIDGRVPNSSLPSSITPPFLNIKNNINKTDGVFATEMTLPSSFGIDFSLYAALNDLNTPWYVIKRSMGGTSISPLGDSQYHWTPFYEELDDISKSLLYTFHSQIAKCEDINPATFDFRALIWQQGEGDRASTSKRAALDYYKNFKCLIAYIRGITGNETLPVVCGTVSHLSGQYDQTVEEATLRVASEDPYITCIDMSGAGLLDAYHFNADAAVYFGYKAYDALIDFGVVSGTKINPTRPW